jgi:hypothetical protein
MTIARYFIIAIFLFAPSAAARQGGAITGRVVADDGEEVTNVTVSLYAVGAQSGGPRTIRMNTRFPCRVPAATCRSRRPKPKGSVRAITASETM